MLNIDKIHHNILFDLERGGDYLGSSSRPLGVVGKSVDFYRNHGYCIECMAVVNKRGKRLEKKHIPEDWDFAKAVGGLCNVCENPNSKKNK